jgi:hypothetical protein
MIVNPTMATRISDQDKAIRKIKTGHCNTESEATKGEESTRPITHRMPINRLN